MLQNLSHGIRLFLFYSYFKCIFFLNQELNLHLKSKYSPHNYVLRVTLAKLYEIYMDVDKSGIWCKYVLIF